MNRFHDFKDNPALFLQLHVWFPQIKYKRMLLSKYQHHTTEAMIFVR